MVNKFKCDIILNGNLIRLEIQCHEWSGGPKVIGGQEHLERFLDTLSDKTISRDTVNLIGNTPFKSISTFRQGIPSYREFVVYGEFKEGYSKFMQERNERYGKVFN